MSFDVSLIVEIVLTVLLVATVSYCAVLERRLGGLRKDQAALGETVAALNSGIMRAQTSLAQLRSAAAEAGGALDKSVATARALTDELSLMVAAGERAAARIETGRSTAQVGAAPRTPSPNGMRGPAAQLAENLRALR